MLADVISGLGVGMTTVGANWYMLQQTHSNKFVGFYLTVNVLAGFLMSPLAGEITDRFSRRNVILWSFIGRTVPMLLIAGLFYFTGFNLILMYVLSIITGAGWITYMSSSRSFVQAILPKSLLGTANSFIEVSLQVGMFMAGAISGIILHYVGFLVILIINILVFGIAVLLILGVKKDVVLANSENNPGLEIKDGIAYVFKHKLVTNIGLLSVLPLVVTQLFNVSSPDYVSTVLKSNSVVYGTADMLYGVGGLGAGIITSWLISRFKHKSLIVILFSLATFVLAILFLWHYVGLLFISAFFIGFSNSSLRVVINTVLMRIVDQAFMGRVTSLLNGFAQLIEIFASSIMGIANDQFGAGIGFLCMSLIMGIGVIWSAVTLHTKEMEN